MVRKYNIVIDYIHSLVKEKGDAKLIRVPSERELMEICDVSRSTVREALLVLEYTGFIDNKMVNGRFIAQDYKKTFFKPLNTFVSMFEEENHKSIFEVQIMIYMQLLSLTYQNLDSEKKARLKEIDDALQDIDVKSSSFVRDSVKNWTDFNKFIYKTAENEVLTNLSIALDSFGGDYSEEYSPEMYDYCVEVNQFHKQILEGMLTDNLTLMYKTVEENFVKSHLSGLNLKVVEVVH